MICEKCNNEHNGTYGSGRFCSKQCSSSRIFSKESREKIGNTHRGIPKTDEWKKKISIINTGRKMTPEQIQKRIDVGFHFSKERNEKISKSLKGTHHTNLHKTHERLAAIKRIQTGPSATR